MKRSCHARGLVFVAFLSFLAGLTACPGSDKDSRNITYKQTTIRGYAPMNVGGTARVLMAKAVHDDHLGVHHESGDQVGDVAIIDKNGHFRLELAKAYGAFVVEASRGHYIEPATNRRVNMGEEKVRAILDGIAVQSITEVALTPWSELIYTYSTHHADKSKVAEARDFLETALGCEDRALTSTAPALPRADAPLQNPSASEVAYIHMGAWSTLARQTSEKAGLGEGGISSARLVRATAEVISRKGALDESIRPADGVALGHNLLRQPFAQAVRQFLGEKREHITIEASAMMDLLRCTSSAANDMWGAQGETLDEQGPTMVLESPAAHTTLMGNANLVCRAHDNSGVANIKARALQNGNDVKAALQVIHVEGIGEIAASIQARINAANLSQGKVDFVCEATDIWGNTDSTSARLDVNHGDASAKVVLEKNAATVAGVIRLECQCDNDYPVDDKACRLSHKSQQEAGLAEMSVGPQLAIYSWDTTQVVDGPRSMTCEARRQGFQHPIAQSEEVVVKNHEPVKVYGQVHLDTPVRHVRVMAYAYDGSEKLKKLGEARSEDGSFVLLLSNEHKGAVLFEAIEDQDGKQLSTYKSLAVDAEVQVGNRKLRLLWENYQPGESLPRVYINGLTDLAQAYADALLKLDEDACGDYRLASVMAHRRLGQYVSPQGLDPRFTPGADLSGQAVPVDQGTVHLALWHVGLSRLAAEMGGSPYQKSSLDLLEKLRIDLQNGVFDGRGGEDADDVMLNQSGLTRETLRSDLSHALNSWLEKRPLGDIQSTSNKHFKAFDFIRPGQMLHHMTANRTALFGGEAGRVFDDTPPSITVEIRQADVARWKTPSNTSVHGIFYIRATVSDDSGVQALNVTIDGRPLVPLESSSGLPSPKLVSLFRHNTEDNADGTTLLMRFNFQDTVGNVGNKTIRLLVDKMPAELTLPTRMVVNDGNVVIQGTVSKPLHHIDVHDGSNVISFDGDVVDEEDGRFSLNLALAPNWTHTLSFTAIDLAGNTSRAQQVVVVCDSLPPVISWQISKFTQQTPAQEIIEIGANGTAPPTLHLQMSTLDVVFGTNDTRAPSVRFRVEDQSDRNVGSPPGAIDVEYAYEYRGEGAPLIRPWGPLPVGAATATAGEYRLALTYQNLLPQHLQDQPASTARAANIIGRSLKTDLHRIFIRAKDQAGNVSEQAFDFHLSLSSPSVTMRCTPMVARIQASRQETAVTLVDTPGTASFSVSYTWGEEDKSTESLTPRGALRITSASSSAEWRIVEKLGTFRSGAPQSYVAAASHERFSQLMAVQVPQMTLEGTGQTVSSAYVSAVDAPLVTGFWGTQDDQEWHLYWTSFRSSDGKPQGGASKIDVRRAAMLAPTIAAIDSFPAPAGINIDSTCGASVAHLAMSEVERI